MLIYEILLDNMVKDQTGYQHETLEKLVYVDLYMIIYNYYDFSFPPIFIM